MALGAEALSHLAVLCSRTLPSDRCDFHLEPDCVCQSTHEAHQGFIVAIGLG